MKEDGTWEKTNFIRKLGERTLLKLTLNLAVSFLTVQGKREMGWVLAKGDLWQIVRELCETKPETLKRGICVCSATLGGKV